MNWAETRGEIEDFAKEAITAGRYEPRIERAGTRSVVRCGVPGHGGWNFEVHIRLGLTDTAVVGLKLLHDEMVEGLPRHPRSGAPIQERSFYLHNANKREWDRFGSAIQAEVAGWVARREAEEDDSAVVALAEGLQEMVSRDPEAAGQAIAALLAGKFDRYEIETLNEILAEANRSAPAP
jgi:hypothetical protein